MAAKPKSETWQVVASSENRWFRPLGMGWNLVAELGRTIDGRPCLTALGIERDEAAGPPDASGIGSQQWRGVNVGAVLDQIVSIVSERDRWRGEAQQEDDVIADFRADDWTLRGRSGHPPLLYARLAYAYDLMIRNGIRTPKQNLAEEMNCSLATANTRLAKARALKLLSAADQGLAGGHLTKEGQVLIAAAYPLRASLTEN